MERKFPANLAKFGKMSAVLEKEYAVPPSDLEEVRRFAQLSFADLGWRTLRNDPAAQASMPPVDASLTFAHPDLGVALVDMAPDRAADPVERLRRRLEALETRPAFATELPIVYLPLTSADLWRLNIILDSAFASPAPVPGEGNGWVDVVQQALLPESFPPVPEEPKAAVASTGETTSRPRSRSLRPWMLLGLAALLAGAVAIYGLDAPGEQVRPAGPVALAVAPDEPVAVPAPPAAVGMAEPAPAARELPPEEPPAPDPALLPAQPAVADAHPPQETVASPKQPESRVSPRRIIVHSVAAGRETAKSLIGAVASAGDEVEFRTLRTTLNIAAVRYFHSADKAAAEDLAERLGPAWHVQDLTRYRPSPRRGSLEIWLPRSFRAG